MLAPPDYHYSIFIKSLTYHCFIFPLPLVSVIPLLLLPSFFAGYESPCTLVKTYLVPRVHRGGERTMGTRLSKVRHAIFFLHLRRHHSSLRALARSFFPFSLPLYACLAPYTPATPQGALTSVLEYE